jgi:hypothetical protein
MDIQTDVAVNSVDAGTGSWEVQSVRTDIVRAVNAHVREASVCTPVFSTADYDTHLLFTYCHRFFEESRHRPMVVQAMLVGAGSATLARTTLAYDESRSLSVRDVIGPSDFQGACFAWSQPEGEPGGFRVKNHRLAPIFYAFYQGRGGKRSLDCVHSSPARSNYRRERIVWVPESGARVTSIVCAPLDAYRAHAGRLHYRFGLKEGDREWRYVSQSSPFTPTMHVDLGAAFGVEFTPASAYYVSVEGPKGKGWLLIEGHHDFNLHHL